MHFGLTILLEYLIILQFWIILFQSVYEVSVQTDFSFTVRIGAEKVKQWGIWTHSAIFWAEKHFDCSG